MNIFALHEIIPLRAPESFSLRRLARQIGYSPAAIYRHFRDKDEIFSCLR